MTDSTATAETPTSPGSGSMKRTYIVVGVVAAAVSAATAAYIFYVRSRQLAPHIDSVQQLLDRCHDQVQSIEKRLGELHTGAMA